MDVEDHVTGVEADDCVGMGGSVIEEAGACCHGGFGTVGLGAGDGVESLEDRIVNGSAVVK